MILSLFFSTAATVEPVGECQFAAVEVDGDLAGEIIFRFQPPCARRVARKDWRWWRSAAARVSRTSSVAMGWLDRRTPMPPLAIDQRARNIVARWQHQRQRPRPEARHQ